jgi:hypothetical protein
VGLISNIRDGLLLRRMVEALESIAESQRTLAELATDADDPQSIIPEVKPFVLGALDVNAANAEYKRRVMQEQGLGTDEEYEDWLERRRI